MAILRKSTDSDNHPDNILAPMTYRPSRSLLAGLAILFLPLLLAEPVGRALGACNDALGCTAVVFVAGAPAGIAAGLVVKRWWDVLELVVGMWLGAVAYGILVTALGGDSDLLPAAAKVLLEVPIGAAVFIGFLGVPLFVIVGLVRWAGRRHADAPAADRPA